VRAGGLAVSRWPEARRPKMIWFNAALVAALLVLLVWACCRCRS
jgi:CitMHS family citrate-Mg2+:H+ or citrate-Ca2+:H+ symporter